MYRFKNKVTGNIVEAVQWDGVGLPTDCPEWLRACDGKPLHMAPAIHQSGSLLFINDATVYRTWPTDFIIYAEGLISTLDVNAFGQYFEPAPEPEPESEEPTEPGAPE